MSEMGKKLKNLFRSAMPHLEKLLPNRSFRNMPDFQDTFMSFDKSVIAGLDLEGSEAINRVMTSGKSRIVSLSHERLNGKVCIVAQAAVVPYEAYLKSKAVILDSDPATAAKQLVEFLK